ncbi:inovirus Gp2 family protein [Acidovorax sp. RAC01]|uniref:inovirus Gp2 family protein n=1 Tax=Acidovorax sp. RAC01 TaxID=1842533 RepID=UPI00085587E0|nr:inovirus Gp2 family protein [Acidovorax sp. RAC01]AOG22107.1 hypothetical protein BSY15_4061 [Acidovorax sp. RAC01]
MNQEQFSINKNHRLYFGNNYCQLPLLSANEPMVEEYLEALHRVIKCALEQYGRVFAFRVDLHLPLSHGIESCTIENSVLSRFLQSLKAKIAHGRMIAKLNGNQFHDTKLRYFWVREVGVQGRPHFHLVILLNGHAYNWLGNYQSPAGNMANRVWEAWASALGMHVDDARSLVHFPENPSYILRRTDPDSFAAFFRRASYLCKARTKQYGAGHHGYGASRQ